MFCLFSRIRSRLHICNNVIDTIFCVKTIKIIILTDGGGTECIHTKNLLLWVEAFVIDGATVNNCTKNTLVKFSRSWYRRLLNSRGETSPLFIVVPVCKFAWGKFAKTQTMHLPLLEHLRYSNCTHSFVCFCTIISNGLGNFTQTNRLNIGHKQA